MPALSFPPGFVWGSAASAYQTEGRWAANGITAPTVWDTFCQRPGATYRGHQPDVCCDCRRRYRDDIRLMREIGLRAFRFSINWARIQPDGRGKFDEAELAYYDDFVDGLLAAGIEPYLCLHHWELPQALHDHTGGWTSPDLPRHFADYAAFLAGRFSDRVTNWLTFNEPAEIPNALQSGRRAPGIVEPLPRILLAIKHALLAHGGAVQALRAQAARPVHISLANVCDSFFPASESAADIEAARRMMFQVRPDHFAAYGIWTDALFRGAFDPSIEDAFGDGVMPEFSPGEWKIITTPIDSLGVNCYFGVPVECGPDGHPRMIEPSPGSPITTLYWPMTERALYWVPKFLHERYGCRMTITENGMACMDWVGVDGRVHDPQRIDFFHRHFRELHRAISEGLPIGGLFTWTLLDNFEWNHGFSQRFGLIHVDFETQVRTPKDSARWLAGVIRENAIPLHAVVD